MPLSKPLPALQQELRDLLVDDLAGALKMLQQLLPPGSEKAQTVTTLLGKLNDTNKARLRGTIANDELQRAYNQLRSDLLDLVDGLAETDFDPAVKTPEAKKAKQGEILYRIPHAMPLGRETRCLVRIALSADAIVENITLDEHVTLKELSRVSDLMQVELVDPADTPTFKIRAINTPEQLVEDEGYTEWLFQVTPLRAGTFPLMIKVAVIELVLGKERKKEIVLEEVVRITTEAVRSATEPPLKSAGEALVFHGPAASTTTDRAIEPQFQPAPAAAPPVRPVPGGSTIGGIFDTAGGIPRPSSIFTPQDAPAAPQSTAPRKSTSKPLRAVALFLAFLVLSAGATWAVAPAEAAWVQTRFIQNTPEAYETYAQKYPESRHRETALFRKALTSKTVQDFRNYLNEYQGKKGKYLQEAVQQLRQMENQEIEAIRQHPTVRQVQQYLQQFPTGERLSEVKRLVTGVMTEQQRTELLPLLENAYVESLKSQPSAQKVRQYLTDFPESERLPEVARQVVQDSVLRPAQAAVEAAILKKIEENPTAAQVQEYLQTFPEPERLEQLKTTVEQVPNLKRRFLPQLKKIIEEQVKTTLQTDSTGGKNN